ncbi:hypothetical protein CBR_g31682 [Chara braunii]|uniref:Ataxin-10 domain-containing protein n=1 Tax=Chara braunii TaxID=69332 RepID=A0A388JY81_CHABU|nr:hypothetical protein CBR_g31682 [Chara braunii]|eukprot:GBG62663.1 hypothetical protein CBR_g31682 [Chara braunii]
MGSADSWEGGGGGAIGMWNREEEKVGVVTNQGDDVRADEVQGKERQGNRVRNAGRGLGSGQGGEEEIARQEEGLNAEAGEQVGIDEIRIMTNGLNYERDRVNVEMKVMERERERAIKRERSTDRGREERTYQIHRGHIECWWSGSSKTLEDDPGERRPLQDNERRGCEKRIGGGKIGRGAEGTSWTGGTEAVEKEERRNASDKSDREGIKKEIQKVVEKRAMVAEAFDGGNVGESLLNAVENRAGMSSEVSVLVDDLNHLIAFSKQTDGRRNLGCLGAISRLVRVLRVLLARSARFLEWMESMESTSQSSGDSPEEEHDGLELSQDLVENVKGERNARLLSPSPELKSIMLLLRVLRNLCAGVAVNQDAFLACNAHVVIAKELMMPLVRALSQTAGCQPGRGTDLAAVLPPGQVCGPHSSQQTNGTLLGTLADRGKSGAGPSGPILDPEVVKDVLRAGLQALGNFVGGGDAHKDAVFRNVVMDGILTSVARVLPDNKVQDPLCMILYSCCFSSPERKRQLCHTAEGRKLIRLLLQAFLLDVNGYSTMENRDGGGAPLSEQPPAASTAGSVSPPSECPREEQSMAVSDQRLQNGSAHGGGEWLDLLVQSLCVDDVHLGVLFQALADKTCGRDNDNLPTEERLTPPATHFTPEQVGLVMIVCEIVIDRTEPSKSSSSQTADDKHVGSAIAILEENLSFILTLVRQTVVRVGEIERERTSSPLEDRSQIEKSQDAPAQQLLTGVIEVDLLGLGLRILRALSALDIRHEHNGQANRAHGQENADVSNSKVCAQQSPTPRDAGVGPDDVYDRPGSMSKRGVIPLLLEMLQALRPPSGIRAARKTEDDSAGGGERNARDCDDRAGAGNGLTTLPQEQRLGLGRYPHKDPFRGYRRDLVAIIGNLCFRRKYNQDLVRQNGGLLTMLQQCVTDDDNPFLREWGFWAMRNLIEGNEENRKELEGLEVQGAVQTPELASLGLKVEVNEQTRRPKLVNIGAGEGQVSPQ